MALNTIRIKLDSQYGKEAASKGMNSQMKVIFISVTRSGCDMRAPPSLQQVKKVFFCRKRSVYIYIQLVWILSDVSVCGLLSLAGIALFLVHADNRILTSLLRALPTSRCVLGN